MYSMVTGAVGVIHMGFFIYTQSTGAACVKKREGEGEGASIFQSTDNHLRIDNKMEFPSETRPRARRDIQIARWLDRYVGDI
jgi:hypothetical protein